MAQWLTQYRLTEVSKEKIVEPEPVSHALFLVKQELEGIRKAVAKQYGKARLAEDVLISGPGNFRCALAKQRPYKGNRDPNHKPVHYQAIRNFLTDKGARVIHGREADDEASILGWAAHRAGQKCVIATIDKDLDQIPGIHFDYRQKVFYEVSPASARRAFWVQVLSGDSTDNIPGCYKVGKTRAADAIDAELHQGTGDDGMWALALGMYEASTALAGCPYAKEQVYEVALETARLVYMQRYPGELWNPPGVPMGTIDTGSVDD